MNEINESLIAETFCSVRNKYHKKSKKNTFPFAKLFSFPFCKSFNELQEIMKKYTFIK